MTWMNECEIEDAAVRFRHHPVLGPATRTLANLCECANRNSDGWPYWQKPSRAAARLMELIERDGTWEYHHGNRPDATVTELKAAYRPVRAFLTRTGLTCEVVEP